MHGVSIQCGANRVLAVTNKGAPVPLEPFVLQITSRFALQIVDRGYYPGPWICFDLKHRKSRLYIKHHCRHPSMNQSVAIVTHDRRSKNWKYSLTVFINIACFKGNPRVNLLLLIPSSCFFYYKDSLFDVIKGSLF